MPLLWTLKDKFVTETAAIKKMRRQLDVRQRMAKGLRSKYKQYKSEGRDIADPYKLMAEQAEWDVQFLKESIATLAIYQSKMEALMLRMDDLDSELRKRKGQ
jgi:hypothetical protein